MEEISSIEIKIVDMWDPYEIMRLYQLAGWWDEEQDNISEILPLIKNSFAFVVALDETTNCCIGIGRAISDRISDAYIQDVFVLPDYRQRGIASRIVKTIVDECINANILWIALIAEVGVDSLYAHLGFEPMETGNIPMQYIVKKS